MKILIFQGGEGREEVKKEEKPLWKLRGKRAILEETEDIHRRESVMGQGNGEQ